jgi:tRNA nucleotidyltransferase/poly(A) polymerase
MKFKLWLENEEKAEYINIEIPMPNDIMVLNDLFKKHNKKLYAVGGVIRDFLISHFHMAGKGSGPKDVDLTTDATPDQITAILKSQDSLRHGIKVLPKGEAFGVISAILNGNEYEIATFREEYYDPISGDGRRPDKVSFSTADKDASRRDLTMNALFYDIDKKTILDFNTTNGKGQGIEDIKNLVARPVGNPYDRFREDKLRVLRLIRFFSRFNANRIKDQLDSDTLGAIEKYKTLEGVSGERIVAEFMSGFKSAKDKSSYLKNYQELGLFPAVLPGLIVNTQNIESVKSFPASLAFILRDNTEPTEVRKKLSALKYTNDVSDKVELLLKLNNLETSPIIPLIKRKEILQGSKDDILEFAKLQKNNIIHKFADYKQQTNSKDFMHMKGPEIANSMNQKEKEIFLGNM